MAAWYVRSYLFLHALTKILDGLGSSIVVPFKYICDTFIQVMQLQEC